jgi:hypothetical protein
MITFADANIAFDRLAKIVQQWTQMNELPIIIPKLSEHGRKWSVTLEEKWKSVDDAGNYYNSRELDKRVDWTVEELSNWDTCSRTAWDTWQFNSHHDAEKFIVYYTLKWAK